MKHVTNYNNFCIKINEEKLFYHFVDVYYNSDIISQKQRESILESVNNNLSEFLNEGEFFNKLKDRYDKAKEVVKNVPDAAKKSLETIIDAAKSSVDFVKNLISQLNKYIKSILTNTVQKIKDKLKVDQKFKDSLNGLLKEKKDGIKKDLLTFKGVLDFYTNKFVDIISSKVSDGITKVITSEDGKPVTEALEMGKNVISTLIHGIEKVPPFNWLNKVKEMGEKGANSIVGAVSYFTKNIGGPEFALPVVAALIGIALEYNIKGLAKTGLIDLIGLATVPLIATLIKIIAWVATIIAGIMVIDDIGGFKILAHDGHGNHEEHKEEKIQETPQSTQSQQTT